jgi:YegS/Rv2252/BmrU family lipid kinase
VRQRYLVLYFTRCNLFTLPADYIPVFHRKRIIKNGVNVYSAPFCFSLARCLCCLKKAYYFPPVLKPCIAGHHGKLPRCYICRMHRHIIYIINPVSGTKTKKNIQRLIEEKTTRAGIAYQIFPSVANADYSFLHSIIREQHISDVVIAGGDGTASQVIAGLIQFNLNFGILPCGSGNGLAYAAKIPSQTEKALDIIFKGNAAATDGFYVNGRFACMLCGLGFDAKVAHDFAQRPGRGLTTYIQQVVKNFFSAKTYRFGIETGHSAFETESFFISIANSNQYGNNFTIAPRASLSDGLLDVVILTKQNKLNVLLNTISQLRGKIKLLPAGQVPGRRGVIYFQAEKIRITNTDNAPLHMDGDPAETSSELIIEIKKQCFRLIQP